MTPLKKIVELGYYLNIDEDSNIIDFCCGYGEMLRIWSDAYGSSGLGIEIYDEFVLKGNERIKESCLEEKVQLLNTDAKSYNDTLKYDVVCLSGENLLGDLESNIKFMESFLKSDGKILIGTPYYTSDIIPKELIDFEGELNTLMEIYKCVRKLGYNLIHFSTGDHHEWERYISWSARRDIESMKSLTTKKEIADKQQWIDYWHKMYFEYRRNYESWGMFIIEK
jgi:ubiquinone/menaquinone biosynthesis C-methylase UbiE